MLLDRLNQSTDELEQMKAAFERQVGLHEHEIKGLNDKLQRANHQFESAAATMRQVEVNRCAVFAPLSLSLLRARSPRVCMNGLRLIFAANGLTSCFGAVAGACASAHLRQTACAVALRCDCIHFLRENARR